MNPSKNTALLSGTAEFACCGWLVENDGDEMLSSGVTPFEKGDKSEFCAAVVYFRDFPRITA